MESDLCSQSEILAEQSGRYLNEFKQYTAGKSFDLVLLVARGSSDNAALFARYLIEITLGIPVSLAAPSVITQYQGKLNYPKTLCIGISQSGAGPDVADVIRTMRGLGHHTVGITNTPGSLLSQEAEFTLDLQAGEELAVAATKTYTTSLLALYQMVKSMAPQLPDVETPTCAWIEKCHDEALQNLGPVLRCSTLFSLARGYSFSTAFETALKLMECALLPCKAFSTADFQHGPKALAGPGSAAISYRTQDPNYDEMKKGLTDQGCVFVDAPEGPNAPYRAIHEIIFGQWVALLAARARGLDPDKPQFLSKVTKTH